MRKFLLCLLLSAALLISACGDSEKVLESARVFLETALQAGDVTDMLVESDQQLQKDLEPYAKEIAAAYEAAGATFDFSGLTFTILEDKETDKVVPVAVSGTYAIIVGGQSHDIAPGVDQLDMVRTGEGFRVKVTLTQQ